MNQKQKMILIEEIETKTFSEIENLRNTFNLHTYILVIQPHLKHLLLLIK